MTNSREGGGFMRMLADELADYIGTVNFFVPFSGVDHILTGPHFG